MAFCVSAFHQVWELVYVTVVMAIQEEGCAGAVLSESVEHLGCVDVGAVVEGQGDCSGDGTVIEDHAIWEGGLVGSFWELRYEWRKGDVCVG